MTVSIPDLTDVTIETDEDILRITLDVVIPFMRTMVAASSYKDLSPNVGPQVYFGDWESSPDDESECGSFACLGGWYHRITGRSKYDPMEASQRWYSENSPSFHHICEGAHIYSNYGSAQEELEARAKEIARMLGRDDYV